MDMNQYTKSEHLKSEDVHAGMMGTIVSVDEKLFERSK